MIRLLKSRNNNIISGLPRGRLLPVVKTSFIRTVYLPPRKSVSRTRKPRHVLKKESLEYVDSRREIEDLKSISNEIQSYTTELRKKIRKAQEDQARKDLEKDVSNDIYISI